jgi:hypothetical protein
MTVLLWIAFSILFLGMVLSTYAMARAKLSKGRQFVAFVFNAFVTVVVLLAALGV